MKGARHSRWHSQGSNKSKIKYGVSSKISAVVISKICWFQCARDRRGDKRREGEKEKARQGGKRLTRQTCRPAWYFTMARPPRGPRRAGARRSYDVASYITLRPLTKDSWWDGSLQDRIIWVVICRRRCWFFSCVLPRTCKTPCGEGPDGLHTHGPLGLYYFSLPLYASPRQPRTDGIFYFVVFRRRAGLAIPPIVSGYFSRHFPYSISSRISQGPV